MDEKRKINKTYCSEEHAQRQNEWRNIPGIHTTSKNAAVSVITEGLSSFTSGPWNGWNGWEMNKNKTNSFKKCDPGSLKYPAICRSGSVHKIN